MATIMQAMNNANGNDHNGVGGGATMPNGFADMTAGAMANMNAMQENLDNTTMTLKFVMSAQRPMDQDKRCSIEIAASATIANVLEMVKMDLNVEDQNLLLEFCGEALTTAAPIHLVGLSDGDAIMVVPAARN